MRRPPAILMAVLPLVGSLAAAAPIPYDDPEYLEAATTILCDCGCHPQSIHECACGRADEMRREVAAMITGGPGGPAMTGEQVIAFFVASRGEQIRIAPTATGFNLVAWLGPGVLLLAAGAGLFFALRRWSRTHASGGPAADGEPPTAIDPDDPYLARVRKELEKYS